MKKVVILIIVIVLAFLGASFWWKNGQSPVNASDSSQKMVVIAKGASLRVIGNDLKEQGIIKDPIVFFIYVKKNNFDRDIQAGSYRFSPSMSMSKIVDILRSGNLDEWVTIPEGLRAEEIAAILEKNIPTYKPEWKEELKKEEGYLFPDTYLIPRDATIIQVISILKNNFNTRIASIGMSADYPNLEKTLIIASLVEREAKFADDRPIVASVIHNRLDSGIALQIDATVQYAVGYSITKKTWWNIPSARDLKIDSPYNTYINVGIPPHPICNPGLSAIQAAYKPADTSYLYYVNDSTGKLHFAKNLTDHNKNVAKYL